ncbi:MAG: zinc ABC transporter substrate-binding protein [Desulfobulbaceae bacterium]|nr:zinc ABC transporter substrate-binding protein [Desulfobulbaceae bacterium]
MIRTVYVFFYAVIVFFMLNTVQARGGEPISIFVSILPEVYFVEKIGGDKVSVHALVSPGQSPHTYAPTPKQMALLADSRAYFRIGVPFENSLVPKIQSTMNELRIIDLRDGISLLEMQSHEETEEDDHNHGEEELDPHIWLDPMLVKRQAELIKTTLNKIDPFNSSFYENNFKTFAGELDTLHKELSEILTPLAGHTIYVFHPAYGYFCRAYGLHQKSVSINGKEPGARHLARLIDSAKAEGVKVIFVQPQFSRKAASSIARAIGGVVVALDPLAEDYIENMKSMAVQIRDAFGS